LNRAIGASTGGNNLNAQLPICPPNLISLALLQSSFAVQGCFSFSEAEMHSIIRNKAQKYHKDELTAMHLRGKMEEKGGGCHE
jgi:hypothetical protein